MKRTAIILAALCITCGLFSQTQVPVPPVLEGNTFDLVVKAGLTEIYPGVQTPTTGYNGSYLGPTLILQNGSDITMNVHNQLADTTTVHWHGLHVAPSNDGGPHTPILPGEIWSPSFEVSDKASTYWYHPHPHGATMRQVLRGAAGVIIVRDEEEAALALPRTYGVDDIPLVFQWKTFDDARQIVESDEQDNEVLVNGVLKGSVLNLPAQIVRLRLLNGSSHRYFDFGFSNNASFKQIGGDAGLLDGPVSMTRLIIAPGERAEILVDLNGKEGQDLSLKQFGTQLPQGYPGGTMMMGGMMGPLDNTDFELVKIHVTAPLANALTSVPSVLTTNTAYPQAGAGVRTFGMTAQPMMSMTNFFINGLKYDMETINFSTQLGKTEVWTLTNMTMMAHPFHVHGNSFYVLSVNGVAPPANMRGRKDVITVPPMQGQVKIIIRFENFSDPEMPYMYHCHILSHEDTGMMGQFLVTDPSSDTKESQNDSSCPICTNFVALPAGLDFSTIASVDIYHQDGRLALSRSEIRSETTGVEISTLPTGVYLMKLSNASRQTVAVRRFFKK